MAVHPLLITVLRDDDQYCTVQSHYSSLIGAHLVTYTGLSSGNPNPIDFGRVFETVNPTRSVRYQVVSVPDSALMSARSPFTVGYQLALYEIGPMTRNPERDTERSRVVRARSPSLPAS